MNRYELLGRAFFLRSLPTQSRLLHTCRGKAQHTAVSPSKIEQHLPPRIFKQQAQTVYMLSSSVSLCNASPWSPAPNDAMYIRQ